MKRIAVEIAVQIPIEQCRALVHSLVEDPAFRQAYRKLRRSGTYPSSVVENTGSRLVVHEATYDPASKAYGLLGTGWDIIYTFQPLPDGRINLGISIEYGLRTAILGMGLVRIQAETEIMNVIRAFLAYEKGLHAGESRPETLLLTEAGRADRIDTREESLREPVPARGKAAE